MTCIEKIFYMDKQFFHYCAYSLRREVVTMVIKINGKPVQVKEEEEKEFDPILFGMTVVGYGLIFWIVWYAFKLFVGVI